MVTRIFLCNEQTEPEIRDFIQEAIAEINEGEPYIVTWSCGSIQTLKVGDRAYFKRIGSNIQGYFASGVVVAADPEYQLRLKSARYRDLSDAYDVDSSPTALRVWVVWDACGSFDDPLRTDELRRLPQFANLPLEPQSDAGVFREEYIRLLEPQWDRHLQRLTRESKGIRLVDVIYRWGIEDAQQGALQDAIANYTQVIKQKPDYVKAYLARGDVYFSQRDYAKALTDYTQAINLRAEGKAAKGAKLAYYKRGQVYFLMGQYQQSLSDLRQAVELDPQYTDAQNALGNTYFKLKSYEQAVVCYTASLNANPQQPQVQFRRGKASFILKEHGDAVADLTQVIDLQPENADAHYYRGAANAERLDGFADLAGARDDLRQAILLYQSQGKPEKIAKPQRLLDSLAVDVSSSQNPSANAIPDEPASLGVADHGTAQVTTELAIDQPISESGKPPYQPVNKLELIGPEIIPVAEPVDFQPLDLSMSTGHEPEPVGLALPVDPVTDAEPTITPAPSLEKVIEVEKVIEKVIERVTEKVLVFTLGERNPTEKAAIVAVTSAYVRDGWQVNVVDKADCGYDLECRQGERIEDVTIKDMANLGSSFTVTAAEIHAARHNPNFVLWVVYPDNDTNNATPQLKRWTGADILAEFDMEPVEYRMKPKPIPEETAAEVVTETGADHD
jgi:tetratricopeptide (TPR) repeat protein